VPGLLQDKDGVPFCKRCAAAPAPAAPPAPQPKASPPPVATTPVWAAAMEAGGIGKPVAPSAEIDGEGDAAEEPPPVEPPAPAPAPAPPASPPAPKPTSPPPAAPPSPPAAAALEAPQAAKALAGARRAALPRTHAPALTRSRSQVPGTAGPDAGGAAGTWLRARHRRCALRCQHPLVSRFTR
jgi:hypothetical protein